MRLRSGRRAFREAVFSERRGADIDPVRKAARPSSISVGTAISLSFVNANTRGGRDTARSANGVANMDTAQIIAGLVLLLCIVGVAYFLAQQRTPPQRQI